MRVDPRVLRVLFFVAVFVAAASAHYVVRPYIAPVLNATINAKSAAFLISVFSPDEKVVASGYNVGAGGTHVRVEAGCDGLDTLLMVLAAVIAFPLPWKRKVIGLVAGTALIYVLNVLRIAGLWYTLRHRPALFETMHVTVGQTVIVIASVIFFAVLTGAFGGAPRSAT